MKKWSLHNLSRPLGLRQAEGSTFPELGIWHLQPRVLIIETHNMPSKIKAQWQHVSKNSKPQYRHAKLWSLHTRNMSWAEMFWLSQVSSYSWKKVGTSCHLASPHADLQGFSFSSHLHKTETVSPSLHIQLLTPSETNFSSPFRF